MGMIILTSIVVEFF